MAGRGGGGGGGGPVLLSSDGTAVFYSGTINDKNPQEVGPKTFIDRVAIKTGEKQRVFESNNNGVWERVSNVLDIDAKRFILTSESPTTVPQQFLVENGTRKQLTNNEDLAPDLTSAPKQRFVVERPDGFKFRVTVTLPPGYQAGTKLPAMFWFYPREFTTQEQYDQPNSTFNKNSFQTFGARSMAYLVRLGYAVVEPDSPIVGAAGEMNNNYVHDLRSNLAAVIDELDRRGLADRTRLGIGGHSYGAFSTVNAMVHTPFFKAGIAGDGAYNRTLDTARLPVGAPRLLAGAAGVHGDVAVLLRQQPDGRAADVSRPARSERRHRPDQLGPAVPRAERARQDGGALHVPARRSRPGDSRDDARSVGALVGVAAEVREEPRQGREAERHTFRREWTVKAV